MQLLVISHGSSIEPNCYDSLVELGRILGDEPDFAHVAVGFYKQEPTLKQAWNTIDGDRVVVVPYLASAGFFASNVLPKKLGFPAVEFGKTFKFDGRQVVYTEPVGTHPSMSAVVDGEARRIVEAEGLEVDKTSLVIVGHGTPRHADSGKSVHDCVRILSESTDFATVVPAFVDEEPFVDGVLDHVPAGDVIVVPYFVANGPHVREDIPAGLGFGGDLWANPHQVGGHNVWYVRAIGTVAAMGAIVKDRARARMRELGW